MIDLIGRREVLKRLGVAGALGALAPYGARSAHAADKLVVGVIYVGPRDDYGYNQAQAQAAAAMKKMPGVSVIEQEKVPETTDVQKTMGPKITTLLVITGDWALPVKEAEAANSLVDQGVDVLTCHVDSPKVVVETAERRGISVCGYHANQSALAPKGYLTGAEWNWVTPYTIHIQDAIAGKPMVNFMRGGLKEGFVRASGYGKAVVEGARKNADTVKAQMLKGDYVIFMRPVKGNKGQQDHD